MSSALPRSQGTESKALRYESFCNYTKCDAKKPCLGGRISITNLMQSWSVLGKLSITSTEDINSQLFVKTKSIKLDPLVGDETHCSKDKSSSIESNKEEFLSDLFIKGVFQSILGRLKSPQIKIGHFEGIKDKEYWSSNKYESRELGYR